MSNLALQERIEQYAAKGRSFLEKMNGEPIEIRDLSVLVRNRLKDPFYALLITEKMKFARSNGRKLEQSFRYSEVVNALRGLGSDYNVVRSAEAYILSMYNLSDLEGKEKIKDGLFKDLVQGVPYVGNLLVTIIQFENNKNNYK